MSLFKEVEKIIEYTNSIRKLEKYLSFDLVFPSTWSILKSQVDESKTVFHKNDEKGKTVSFLSEINEESISDTISRIENIISFNKEKEEKQRLFNEKVSELKNLFEKEGLDELKSLKFDIDETPRLEGTEESIS
jgi:hypothetical protein